MDGGDGGLGWGDLGGGLGGLWVWDGFVPIQRGCDGIGRVRCVTEALPLDGTLGLGSNAG